MKKFIYIAISILLPTLTFGQAETVEVGIFQKEATATTSTIGIRVRATGAPVNYTGVTFYMLYQSTEAAPQSVGNNTVVGVDDSKLVTQYGWGVGNRSTAPAAIMNPVFDPMPVGGRTFDRKFLYGNGDETSGSHTLTATATWDTLLYVTLNTLKPVYPQGGYAYMQKTSDIGAGGGALSDENFDNIAFIVNSGEIPLGDLGVLPVLFSQFDAKCTNNGTLITWATAQEANSSKFEIERSTNGTTWTGIGTVAAAGTSSSSRNYQQIDLFGGAAFYRIKQIDKDGQFIYTDVARTNCQTKNITSVIYPVPAQDVLNVVIKSDRALRTQLMVYDMQGKLVKKVEASILNGNNNFRINLIDLASGDYMIRTNDATIELNKVFTITR